MASVFAPVVRGGGKRVGGPRLGEISTVKMPHEIKTAIFYALKNEMLGDIKNLSEADLREHLSLIEELILDQPHAQLLIMMRIMEDEEVFRGISDRVVKMAAPAEVDEIKARVLAYYEYVSQAMEKRANVVPYLAQVFEFPNHA
jgi:hypothetical protein